MLFKSYEHKFSLTANGRTYAQTHSDYSATPQRRAFNSFSNQYLDEYAKLDQR